MSNNRNLLKKLLKLEDAICSNYVFSRSEFRNIFKKLEKSTSTNNIIKNAIIINKPLNVAKAIISKAKINSDLGIK